MDSAAAYARVLAEHMQIHDEVGQAGKTWLSVISALNDMEWNFREYQAGSSHVGLRIDECVG
jgi:hypothetical protein